MSAARERLFEPSRRFLSGWLADQAGPGSSAHDFDAIIAIRLGAIENYWAVTSFSADAPFDLDEDRFVEQWVATLRTVLDAS